MEITQFGDREIGELADIIRYYRKNGLWAGQGTSGVDVHGEAGILVKNTEANVIPAYGCMEVVSTADEANQNYITVKKPTSTGTLFLFNNHLEIEASGYGKAQRGPVFRCYKSTGTASLGSRWDITNGQYYLSTATDGRYAAYGNDDIGTDVFRAVDMAALVTVTVVTDIRVSGTTLQYKTRTLKVPAAGAESAWTTWHTGTECP